MKLWIKMKLNIIDYIRNIQKILSIYARKRNTISKKRIIDDFEEYIFLKRYGLSEQECLDLLKVKEEDFQILYQNFENCRELLGRDSFYEFVYEYHIEGDKIKKIVFQTLSYPILLVICMIFACFYFDHTLIPLLNDTFLLFDTNGGSIVLLQIVIRIFWSFGLILIVVFFIIFVSMKNPRFYDFCYQRLYKIKQDNFLVMIESIEFASLFYCLSKSNHSTNIILECMENQKENPFLKKISKNLKEGFDIGKNLKECMTSIPIHSKMISVFLSGEKTGELNHLLKRYIDIEKQFLNKKMKRLSSNVQYGIYFFVAIMIAVLYSVLLSPLSYIKNL